MPVPKTTVHEDDLLQTGEDKVRRAREFTPMQPEAKTESMSHTPNLHLRPSVFALNSRHCCGPASFADNIHSSRFQRPATPLGAHDDGARYPSLA